MLGLGVGVRVMGNIGFFPAMFVCQMNLKTRAITQVTADRPQNAMSQELQ